jgi:hypothetical protein
MKKYFIFIVLSAFVFSSYSYSQSIKAGIEAGLSVPTGDFGGTTNDFYSGKKYGVTSGLNLGVTAKIKTVLAQIRAGINYSSYNNSGPSDPSNPGSTINQKYKMLVISAGPEFNISVPATTLKPYVGFNLLLSTISGDVTFQGVPRVSSGTYPINSASRVGLGLSAGFVMNFMMTELDFSLRYNMHNLFGKSYVVNPSSDSRLESYLNINDAKDPLYGTSNDKHFIGVDRSISTVQFIATVLFGF